MKQEVRNFLRNLSNCSGIVQRNSSKLGNELVNIFRKASIGTTVIHTLLRYCILNRAFFKDFPVGGGGFFEKGPFCEIIY